jgi:6-pyruvoyltetrahydropterin/6-carboxytetrahydropterin synthase
VAHFLLNIKHSFSAARALRDFQGACANIHGHNFNVEVVIKAPEVEQGYAIDYYEVKLLLTKVCESLDHVYINEVAPFTELNPTSENIAKYIYQGLQPSIANTLASLEAVTVAELNEFSVTYCP